MYASNMLWYYKHWYNKQSNNKIRRFSLNLLQNKVPIVVPRPFIFRGISPGRFQRDKGFMHNIRELLYRLRWPVLRLHHEACTRRGSPLETMGKSTTCEIVCTFVCSPSPSFYGIQIQIFDGPKKEVEEFCKVERKIRSPARLMAAGTRLLRLSV